MADRIAWQHIPKRMTRILVAALLAATFGMLTLGRPAEATPRRFGPAVESAAGDIVLVHKYHRKHRHYRKRIKHRRKYRRHHRRHYRPHAHYRVYPPAVVIPIPVPVPLFVVPRHW